MEDINPSLKAAGKSEWQAGLLTKGIRDILWTLDLEGKVTYVSPSVTAHTGYYPEEFYGMPLEHFLAPESAARAREMLKDQLALPLEKRQDSIILELQEKTKAGSYIDIEINTAWMNDETGMPVGFIGITRNITARKRAEQVQREREEKFRAIRTSTADGIVLINGNGFVEYWNPAFEKMFRHSVSETEAKKTPGDVVPEKFREPFDASYRAFRETATETTPPRVVELNAIRGDGTEFPIEITFNPILLEGEFWASAIIRNVTDRKRGEEEHAHGDGGLGDHVIEGHPRAGGLRGLPWGAVR